MGEVSGRGLFDDYRSIGFGVAIMPSVSVVIPAKNEARNLEHVFGTIPDWVNEIVLVDGKSTDDTVEVARMLLPEVHVVHQAGKGKGDALRAGFAAAKGTSNLKVFRDGVRIARFIIRERLSGRRARGANTRLGTAQAAPTADPAEPSFPAATAQLETARD